MVTLILDVDGDGKDYDRELRNDTLPSGDNAKVITKSQGTVGGQAVVMVKFPVQLPNGSMKFAQYTFTQKEVLAIAKGVRAAHPPEEDLRQPTQQPGTTIHKFHDGVGWTALLVEKVYIITVEGKNEINLAFTDEEVEPVARAAVDKALGKI